MSESEEYEEEDEVTEEGVQWVDKNPLNSELIRKSLSDVQKTMYGNGYAYTKLILKRKKLTSLSQDIIKYPNITFLDISQNKIKSIDYLKDIYSLMELKAEHNKIDTLIPFPQEYLQIIHIKNNQIKSLSNSGSPSLLMFDISYNFLENLEGFDSFSHIYNGNFSHNKLVTTKGIKDNKYIKKVNLDDNPTLSKIEDFTNLPSLVEVSINNSTELKSFGDLLNLQSLVKLSCNSSGISEMSEVQKLVQMANLIDLSLSGSPVCDIPNFRQELLIIFPQLQILDGEKYTDEERIEAKNVIQERIDEAKRKEEEERQALLEAQLEEERKREEERLLEEEKRKEEERLLEEERLRKEEEDRKLEDDKHQQLEERLNKEKEASERIEKLREEEGYESDDDDEDD